MPSKEKCRVCGKEYTPCRVHNPVPGSFRWQSVSCSPECGSIYLAKILASRSSKTEYVQDQNDDMYIDDEDDDVEEDDIEYEDDSEYDEEEY